MKTLEQQFEDLLHEEDVYADYINLPNRLRKIAQRYALEQQIDLINHLTHTGVDTQILYKGFDIDLYLQQLENQLKQLQEE